MIDPMSAALRALQADGDLRDLVAGRIAERHRFGMDVDPWSFPSKALQISLSSGGVPELSIAWQRPKLDVVCFGESPAEASRVYLALVAATRAIGRTIVHTSMGDALVYWLLIDGSPQAAYDPDLGIDTILVSLDMAVSEEAV